MRGLDSNVLVRLLTQDDARQARRVDRLLRDAKRAGDRLYVDVVVLCELVWVLQSAYRHDRAAIAEALEAILQAPEIVVEDRDAARRALDDYRAGPGDFSDYLIGHRNVAAGCVATDTFDRRLKGDTKFSQL